MPGDLNLKKSWNPALIKNQKKVWEQEQEALKEHEAIKQRSKEIAHEREREHLIKLQYGNDPENVPAKHRLEMNKLSWMYDGPKEVNEAGFRETEEDFMQNRDNVERMIRGGAVKPKGTSRFDKISQIGSSKAATLSDDPLLLIKKQMGLRRPAESSSRSRSEPSKFSRLELVRNSRNQLNKHQSSETRYRNSGPGSSFGTTSRMDPMSRVDKPRRKR